MLKLSTKRERGREGRKKVAAVPTTFAIKINLLVYVLTFNS
jgi:hypothetical protein